MLLIPQIDQSRRSGRATEFVKSSRILSNSTNGRGRFSDTMPNSLAKSISCKWSPSTYLMAWGLQGIVGISTFKVNGSGFGSDIGGSCGGNGSGSATIFTTSTGFSASGSLNGTVVCSFGGGSTQNFPLTGSFSASASN